MFRTTGEVVKQGDILGIISDPFGQIEVEVLASTKGLIIGRSNFPVVNEGDALFHIATVKSADKAEAMIDSMESQLVADPLFDEDEII